MTKLREWIKHMIEAFLPRPEGNAWDEYKRARAMALVPAGTCKDEESVSLR